MRILLTGSTGECMPPPYGGTSKVSLLYARAYKKLGHDVAITWVYKPRNADDEGTNATYFFEYAQAPNKITKFFFLLRYTLKNPFLYGILFFRYFRVYPRLTLETILYPAYGVFLDGVVRTYKPDIISSQAALIKTFMAAEIAARHNVPIVFEPYAEIHDQDMGVNKHLDRAGQQKYWSYFLSLADLVIGMDNCSVGPLMYLPPQKVKVYYDTIDCGFFAQKLSESKNELRDHFKLPRNRFLIGMVGAFHYRKGHDQLIKAVGMLKRRGIDVGAVIVGGNVGLEKWQDLVREEDVGDRVYFLRNLSEMELVRLHNALDLYANLSNSTRSCGLDLALLGAMAAGLPVVVYDNGALPTAVPTGDNGLIVSTNDVAKLAEALSVLAQKSPEELRIMGEASQRVMAKCDINFTSKEKIGWFEDIILKRLKNTKNRI